MPLIGRNLAPGARWHPPLPTWSPWGIQVSIARAAWPEAEIVVLFWTNSRIGTKRLGGALPRFNPPGQVSNYKFKLPMGCDVLVSADCLRWFAQPARPRLGFAGHMFHLLLQRGGQLTHQVTVQLQQPPVLQMAQRSTAGSARQEYSEIDPRLVHGYGCTAPPPTAQAFRGIFAGTSVRFGSLPNLDYRGVRAVSLFMWQMSSRAREGSRAFLPARETRVEGSLPATPMAMVVLRPSLQPKHFATFLQVPPSVLVPFPIWKEKS
jgi:hypothetical protein